MSSSFIQKATKKSCFPNSMFNKIQVRNNKILHMKNTTREEQIFAKAI